MNKSQRGFTIVELMIAISILSVILLLVSVGIIQLSKSFYRGIALATTQQANRSLLQDISESIEFGSFSGLVSPAPQDFSATHPSAFSVNAMCFGTQRYSYVMRYQLASEKDSVGDPAAGNSKHVLWKDIDSVGGCKPVDVGQPLTGSTGSELLGEHMRLTQFKVELANPCSPPSTGCSDTLYKISTTIMYGDDDLFDKSDPIPAHWKCKSQASLFAAAFCAKSELTTVVGKRLS